MKCHTILFNATSELSNAMLTCLFSEPLEINVVYIKLSATSMMESFPMAIALRTNNFSFMTINGIIAD